MTDSTTSSCNVDSDFEGMFYDSVENSRESIDIRSNRRIFVAIILQHVMDFCYPEDNKFYLREDGISKEKLRREAKQWLLYDERKVTLPKAYELLRKMLIGKKLKYLKNTKVSAKALATMPKSEWWNIVVKDDETMIRIKLLSIELDKGTFADYCDHANFNHKAIRQVLRRADKNPRMMERLRKDSSIYLTTGRLEGITRLFGKEIGLGRVIKRKKLADYVI